jgi:hypothetical protein
VWLTAKGAIVSDENSIGSGAEPPSSEPSNSDEGSILTAPIWGAAPEPATPAPTFLFPAAGHGIQDLALERRPRTRQRSTGVIDWVAFVLAFLAPPAGILAGVAALIISSVRNGWTTGIAKAAIAIGLVLTIVLIGAGVVLGNVAKAQAGQDAIVSSSAKWCSAMKANPAVLRSPTYGWPAVGSSIDSSVVAMQRYENFWAGLTKLAPAGIASDTRSFATTAQAIIAGVKSTRVLDDAANTATLAQLVTDSRIPSWVSSYCK